MSSYLTTTFFKKIIVIFWTIWWLAALWTDTVGGLAHLGLLHGSWAPDTNYPFLVSTLSMYNVPVWLPPSFFIGILIWSLVSTLAFVWASCALRREPSLWLRRAEIAFVISLTYWLTFFIADQAVMKFDLEENHMVQGGFQLLTFLALYLLPDQSP